MYGIHRLLLPIALAAGIFCLSPTRAQNADTLLRRGIALFNESRFQEADEILHQALAAKPDDPEIEVLLGFLNLRRSEIAAAQRLFAQVLERYPNFATAHLGAGMALLRLGLPEKASQEFESILGDSGLDFRARTHWIYSLFLKGQVDQALEAARGLILQFPHETESHELMGQLLMATGNATQARQEFMQAAASDPTQLAHYFGVIEACKADKDWRCVLYWTDAALNLDGSHPLLFQNQAIAYRQVGQQEDAQTAEHFAQSLLDAELLYTQAVQVRVAGNKEEHERLLRRCVEVSPRLSKAWLDLGNMALQREHLKEARLNFVMAQETDPGNVLAYLGLATAFRAQGKSDEAIRTYEKAIARGLQHTDLYTGLAAALMDQGRTEQATVLLEKAAGLWPDEPELISYLGYVQQAAGNSSAASHSFRSALELDPHLSNAREGMAADDLQQAFALMNAGDYAEAARRFENLWQQGTHSKSLLDGLGFSFEKTGSWNRASTYFEESLKRYGPDSWVHSHLGYAYRGQGKMEAAVSSYRHARDLAPNDPVKHYDLAFALYLNRKYEAAVEPFQQALRLKPDWGQAHFDSAMNYWNLRQYAPALEHARKARQLGVQQAEAIVQKLTAYLSLGSPRLVSVWQAKSFRPQNPQH